MLGGAPNKRRSPDLLWPRPSHSRGRIGNEHQRTLRWALKPQAGLLALDNLRISLPTGYFADSGSSDQMIVRSAKYKRPIQRRVRVGFSPTSRLRLWMW
jgi:hypothetical protein